MRTWSARAFAVAGFLLVSTPLIAAPQGPADLAGHWEGAIELPGLALTIKIDLAEQGGAWSGTIDIPMQSAKGLALSEIVVSDAAIGFAIAGVPGNPKFQGTLAEGKITGGFSQGGQNFPFHLGREVVQGPKRPQEPHPPFPYRVEEVGYSSGEIKLSGTLTLPQGDGPFAAVFLVSGSGPQDRNEEVFGHKPFLLLADDLTRAGVAVLRADDRGVGGSTGDLNLAATADLAQDALAAVAFLESRPEIDKHRIGLLGHSEGGYIAPLAASRSADVAFLVLMAAPGVPGDEVLIHQVGLGLTAAGLSPEKAAEAKESLRALVGLVKSGADSTELMPHVYKLVEIQNSLMGSSTKLTPEQIEQQGRAVLQPLTTPWFRHFLSYDPIPGAARGPRPRARALRRPRQAGRSRTEPASARAGVAGVGRSRRHDQTPARPQSPVSDRDDRRPDGVRDDRGDDEPRRPPDDSRLDRGANCHEPRGALDSAASRRWRERCTGDSGSGCCRPWPWREAWRGSAAAPRRRARSRSACRAR